MQVTSEAKVTTTSVPAAALLFNTSKKVEEKEELRGLTPKKPDNFQNNQFAYLYSEEDKKDQELYLNNNAPSSQPEKQMVCWNCLAVLTVKPYWGIIQCPNCDKFNRVPDCDDDKKPKIKLDKNNFDVVSPYVYVVMTCPYCKEDNKVKKETEHVVCHNCYNSFSIENPTIKCISSKKPVQITNKVTRVSDINFPDPMYFQGYYPQPNPLIQVPCQGALNGCCGANADLVAGLTQEIMKETSRPKSNINQNFNRSTINPYDKWGPLRQTLRDVGQIEYKRNLDFQISGGGYQPLMNSSLRKVENDITYDSMPTGKFNVSLRNTNNKNTFSNNNSNNARNNEVSYAPSSNFYSRYQTPNQFTQSNKNTFINKMMFSSWNNQ